VSCALWPVPRLAQVQEPGSAGRSSARRKRIGAAEARRSCRMPLSPEELYLQLCNLVAEMPDLVSAPITPDMNRWLGRACALVEQGGDLSDTVSIAQAQSNALDAPYRFLNDQNLPPTSPHTDPRQIQVCPIAVDARRIRSDVLLRNTAVTLTFPVCFQIANTESLKL
jgi:hypothetical protein